MLRSFADKSFHEELLTCHVCWESFDTDVNIPKSLPRCGHTLCLCCVRKIADPCSPNSLNCPFCRLPSTTQGNILSDIPDNWTIKYMINGNKSTPNGSAASASFATSSYVNATCNIGNSQTSGCEQVDTERQAVKLNELCLQSQDATVGCSSTNVEMVSDLTLNNVKGHAMQGQMDKVMSGMKASSATKSTLVCTIIVKPVCTTNKERVIIVKTNIRRPRDMPVLQESLAVNVIDPKNQPISATMKDEGNNIFEVKYTPTKKGLYKVYIKLYDKQVEGCPLELEEEPSRVSFFQHFRRTKKPKESNLFCTADALGVRGRNRYDYQIQSMGLFTEARACIYPLDYMFY